MARETCPAMLMRAWTASGGGGSADQASAQKTGREPAGRWPQQDTVLLLSCLEAQKLRFQGVGPLRCATWSFPPGVIESSLDQSPRRQRGCCRSCAEETGSCRDCPRVYSGAEAYEVGSSKWNERFKLDHVPRLRVPAPISLMQFDCVVLRNDSQSHPFTIGGQQDRFNSHPTFVSNRHQHRRLISWLCGENDAVGGARIRGSLWLGSWPTWLLEAGPCAAVQ